MGTAVTTQQLFENLGESLALEWVAGRPVDGAAPGMLTLESDDNLVGRCNCLHPRQIQVIGKTEWRNLGSLAADCRREFVGRLLEAAPAAVILADGIAATEDFVGRAEQAHTPLFVSRLPSDRLIHDLQLYFRRTLAERRTLHGVFMEVMGMGVLLTGECAVGKSELALELLSRGHRLIADDAPEFFAVAPNTLQGTCPDVLRDFLEVRGLGILNVRAMFGDSVIKPSKYLGLIIALVCADDDRAFSKTDRFQGSRRQRRVLGVDVPEISLPVAPGRNLAVLIEVAVRDHILRMKGYVASEQFCQRQRRAMQRSSP